MKSDAARVDANFDVLIVGGGVIGLSLARELRKSGRGKIAVIERGKLGREASYAAAGMLAPQAESDRDDIFFRFCFESSQLFPELAAELLNETGVDVELIKSGTICFAFDEAGESVNRHRFDWQRAAGLRVQELSRTEILQLEPSISTAVLSGVLFPDEAHVENRNLLASLQIYAEKNEIDLYEDLAVTSLVLNGETVVGVQTAAGTIAAETVVLATGAWTSLIEIAGRPITIPVRPVRGQIICYEAEPGWLRHIIYGPDGYLVQRSDGRILVGATVEESGFENTVTDQGVELLRRMAYEIAPEIGGLKLVDSWSGLRPSSPDAFPILGPVDGYMGLYVATAHYRNGILLSPLTAKLLAAAINEQAPSHYLDRFAAARFSSANAVGSNL